jgi:hypothetical protein
VERQIQAQQVQREIRAQRVRGGPAKIFADIRGRRDEHVRDDRHADECQRDPRERLDRRAADGIVDERPQQLRAE